MAHAFKMVIFHETPGRSETLWVREFPYHYMAFYDHNGYSTIAFNRDIKTPKTLEKYLKALKNKRYYMLGKDGVLDLVYNDKLKNVYRCVAVLKPQNEYVPGDLILTGYTKKGKSKVFKLYRRWY